MEHSELAAMLPCEMGPNKYRDGFYWKFNEPDVLRLERCLRQGVGIEVPTNSQGGYQNEGFAKENGPAISARDAMYRCKLSKFQLERINPVKGSSSNQTKDTEWSYNLCDVKALKRQTQNLAQVICKPSPTVTTDGKGTFYGRKTLSWILNYGSPQEQEEALGDLSVTTARMQIAEQ